MKTATLFFLGAVCIVRAMCDEHDTSRTPHITTQGADMIAMINIVNTMVPSATLSWTDSENNCAGWDLPDTTTNNEIENIVDSLALNPYIYEITGYFIAEMQESFSRPRRIIVHNTDALEEKFKQMLTENIRKYVPGAELYQISYNRDSSVWTVPHDTTDEEMKNYMRAIEQEHWVEEVEEDVIFHINT